LRCSSAAAKPMVFRSRTIGDTWLWDGMTWAQVPTSTAPSPRSGAAIAYDVARDRIILFGGFSDTYGTVTRSDTWEYDPTTHTWTELFPAQVPPAGVNLAMVYNLTAAPCSCGAAPFYAPATWEWNGSAWAPVASAPSQPLGRTTRGMAFDTVRRTTLHFGGLLRHDNEISNRTWEYTTADPPPILRHPQPLSLREGDNRRLRRLLPSAHTPEPTAGVATASPSPTTAHHRSLTPILTIKPTPSPTPATTTSLITAPAAPSPAKPRLSPSPATPTATSPPPPSTPPTTSASSTASPPPTPYANCDTSNRRAHPQRQRLHLLPEPLRPRLQLTPLEI
jgi:hypothetical protein